MTVSLTKVFSTKSDWYCGDFHAHTTCSDGVFSPRGLRDLASEHGLDFLSITDHNAIRAMDDFDENYPLMVLPGLEITLIQGHINIFGFEGNTPGAQELFQTIVDRPPYDVYMQGKEHAELDELLHKIRAAGLITDVCHPLLPPWEWRDMQTEIDLFTCVELINDPTYGGAYGTVDNPTANPATRRMWSAWLNAGYRITALGGTDFHSLEPSDDPKRLSLLNLPRTYVYASELSCQAILEGVRKHHVYVSMGPKIEFKASMNGVDYMMGDDLGDAHDMMHFYARVEGCPSPARAMLIKNGEVLSESQIKEGKFEFEWKLMPEKSASAWYRFDIIGHDPITNADDQSLAISNPIFVGPALKPVEHTFGSFPGS
jgi:hypothetical protein